MGQKTHPLGFRLGTLVMIGKELFRNLDLSQGRNFDLDSYKAFLTGMKDHVEGRLHVSDTSRGRVSPLTIAAQIERNRPAGAKGELVRGVSITSTMGPGLNLDLAALKAVATAGA